MTQTEHLLLGQEKIGVGLFNCFNCRSERHSIFRIGPFGNKWLLAAVALSWAIALAIVYVPFLQSPFHTYPMSLQDWGIVVLAGVSILIPVEIAKLVMARRARPVRSAAG